MSKSATCVRPCVSSKRRACRKVVNGLRRFDGLPEFWDDLWNSDPEATAFQSRAWLQADRSVVTFASFEAGEPTLAVALTGALGTTYRFAGGSFSDVRGPIGRPEGKAKPSEFLRRIAAESGRSLLLREYAHATPDRPMARDSVALLLDLPNRPEDMLTNLGKSLRTDVQRADALSVLEHRGEAAVEPFRHLVRLHQARWRRRALPGAFGKKAAQFHEKFIRENPEMARIWTATTESGDLAGAIYTLHYQSVTAYYQTGIDPQVAPKLSPGTKLVWSAVRSAIENQNLTFDFLRGEEPYKLRWKPTRRRESFRQIIPSFHWTSPLIHQTAPWFWNLEHRVKQHVETHGGWLPRK